MLAGDTTGQPGRLARFIAAGAANRIVPGDPRHRYCARCGRLALRGKPLCVWHNAGTYTLPPTPGRIAARTLQAMDRRGLLPADLVNLRLYSDLSRTPRETRAPLRLALVLAWDHREAEPLRWARVWRDGLKAVRDRAVREAPLSANHAT